MRGRAVGQPATQAPHLPMNAKPLYFRRFLTKRKRFDAQTYREPISGCWLWEGAVDVPPRHAYGKFWDKDIGRSMAAHRASWLIYRGEIPAGTLVLHRCDNPTCVNPEHLFLGSHLDNTRDMVNKGRHMPMLVTRIGERNEIAKLTTDNVRAILASNDYQHVIAARYGVSQSTISHIKTRKVWKHVV